MQYKNYSRFALINIYKHTVLFCSKAKLLLKKSEVYNYTSKDFLDEAFFLKYKPIFDNPAQVIVNNMDSFDMATGMESGGSVLVLNMASHRQAGGGVVNGARAQEEELFRKSNYFQVLDQSYYPLHDTEVIYSPLVHIIKDKSYTLLPNFPTVSCIAVAAIRNPKIGASGNYANEGDLATMNNKIDTIFKVAIMKGHSEIVLGALGCGAFANPPKEVAQIFADKIKIYRNYFKKIGFAVLSTGNNPNFEIFTEAIGCL